MTNKLTLEAHPCDCDDPRLVVPVELPADQTDVESRQAAIERAREEVVKKCRECAPELVKQAVVITAHEEKQAA